MLRDINVNGIAKLDLPTSGGNKPHWISCASDLFLGARGDAGGLTVKKSPRTFVPGP